MKLRTEIIGGHAFYFPEGRAIAVPAPADPQNPVLCDRHNKPDAADPGWFNIGNINIKFSRTQEEHEVWAPSPGRQLLEDVISYKRGIDYTIHCKNQSNLLWQIFLGTDTLPDSPQPGGQFNPLEGADAYGWLKIQCYGRNDQRIMTLDSWVYLKPGGDLDPGDGPAECDLVARLLHSPLNTGVLA
ncbi:hypothetical protein OpiT1DRAFT_00203 [Opitutaceae bacterium TAV1]|nr:hypothetical protein OpiT1DRAFT_00203 [Opitutaceae bacterium TAV1]